MPTQAGTTDSPRHKDRVRSVAFSPCDGTRLATGGDDNTAKGVEVESQYLAGTTDSPQP